MIQTFPHISNTYMFLIILWMLSAVVFILSLVYRDRIPAFIETNNTIQIANWFLKANKIIYRLFLGLAVYILVFRIGLGWQLRVGMTTMYILYFFYFAFLDFALLSFNLRASNPSKKIRTLKIIRWFYVRLRVVYFIITLLAFFLFPPLFLSISLLTPDSGISGYYKEKNGKEYYKRVIDYEDVYGIRSPYSIALDFEPYRSTSFWNFKGALEFDEVRGSLHIYDVYCLFFKKKVQTENASVRYNTHATYFSKDSFFVGHSVILNPREIKEFNNHEMVIFGQIYYRKGKGKKLFQHNSVVLDTNLTIIRER